MGWASALEWNSAGKPVKTFDIRISVAWWWDLVPFLRAAILQRLKGWTQRAFVRVLSPIEGGSGGGMGVDDWNGNGRTEESVHRLLAFFLVPSCGRYNLVHPHGSRVKEGGCS
jgi:hypothetical protein